MYLKLELSSLKVKLDANIFKKSKHNSLSFFVQSHGNNHSMNRNKKFQAKRGQMSCYYTKSLDHYVFTNTFQFLLFWGEGQGRERK